MGESRPRCPPLNSPGQAEQGRAERWSQLHFGIDPAGVPLLRRWLRLMWFAARALRAVPPTVITVLGVGLAFAAVALAGSLPWFAAAAVAVAAICDGLDGAVAVVAERATRSGARADAIADRIADAAFAAVLYRCGVGWPLALAAGVLAVGVDLLRRLRHVPALITVGERPTWTVCAVLACASHAVTSARWPVLVCAGVWVLAGAFAITQIALARRAGPSS